MNITLYFPVQVQQKRSKILIIYLCLLENVQKKMVREVTGLQGRTYEERLAKLGMETLEDRRLELDLVTAFKILKGVDDVDKKTWFTQVPEDRTHRTRAT